MPLYGSKTTIAQRLISLFPPHRRYVEPFFGSGSVLLSKAPVKHEIANDLDGDLMTFWKVLRDSPVELARACAMTPHSRAERQQAKHIPDDADDLERARMVWSALVQGRSGTLANTGWRHSVTSEREMAAAMAVYARRIDAVADRLRKVSLECLPATEVIERYAGDPSTLIYADPPYLGSTRRRNYRVEMTGERVHRDLAAALTSCKATVVLSGYSSPLYDALYDGWVRYEFPTFTTQGGGDSRRVEVVWTNRETRQPDGSEGVDVDGFRALCRHCLRVVPKPRRGPIGSYCSPSCRTSAWRARRASGA